MKRYLQFLILIFGLFLSSLRVYGVTAYPYPVDYRLPDGSSITIRLMGDEKVKWAETPDGYSILFNSAGFYEYAVLDARGDLVPSGIRVNNPYERTDAEKRLLESLPKGLRYSNSQLQMMKQIWEVKSREAQKAFPTTGNRKLVCILMAFTDKSFTKTQSDFNNLFNQVGYTTGGALGSVKDYFNEISYNQFNLTVTVAGPYTAANAMSYYGANDAYGNDVRPDVLVTEAVNAANPDVNYADFDNDNDGNVDGVYVIYAGYGEEAGAPTYTIWAHQWEITPVTLDGKIISTYSCSPELRGNTGTNITRIGVICHEFGHVLGAPDFYDTDGSTAGEYDGTGNWDLQAGGSWNNYGISPAHPNAYTKIYIYNWATATTISSAISLTLNNSAQYSTGFYRYNTTTTNEFFLLENRQQVGFDTYLPGHGLLIYHVDGSYITSHTSTNNINTGSHQGLYPMSATSTTANGIMLSSSSTINSGGCPWPGTGSKTSFTDATTPSSKSWAGNSTNKPLTNITENLSLKTISFDFMGGGAVPEITVSVSSLNFEKVYSGYYSRPQSYTVAGTNLTANITVTAPAGIQVSTSCGSGYSSSVVLTQSGGNVNTTVYARYTSGTVNGNITHASAGATTKNISVNETANSTNLPAGYYSTATGTGQTLKTQLYNIIKDHTQRSYTQLWTDFQTTDARPDGKVWDVYTDIICGTPCSFIFVTDQDDGTGGTAECQKYNREHTFPKSWFGGDVAPMYTDLFHLMPADKYVNNQRGNYAFGVVTTGTTFNNGSQLGTNTYAGGPAITVFEPADDYKGDLARNYFYMATRYENLIASWENNDANGNAMLNGTSYPCFETWAINMLLEWHNADPVDQKELSRNDAVYTLQGNRNPFIDHPEYAGLIWGNNPVLTVSPSTLSGFSYIQGSGPSASQSYSISGSNLTGSGNITITGSTNYEVSSNNSTFSGTITFPYSSGIITGQPKTVYVRLKAGLSAADYNGETITNAGGGATTVNVTCYGQVTSSSSGVVFTETMGSVGGTTTIATHESNNGFDNDAYTMTSGGIANPADIRNTNSSSGYAGASGGANVWFAATSGSYGFAIEGIDASSYSTLKVQFGYRKESSSALPSLALDYYNGSSYVNVPFTFNEASNAASAWYLSPEITLPGGALINGLRLRWVKSGTVAARIDDVKLSYTISSSPTITLSASTLTGFTYMYGYGPSSSQTYNLMGSNLTPSSGNLTITGSTNYEVSTDNSSFGSSKTVSYTSGSLTATPIYVRLKAGLAGGNYNSETITNSGGGATTKNVTCSGSVTAVPDPSITISATSLSFGDECIGNTSAEQTYTVSGTYLTGNIVITPPSGYEISTGSGSSFVATNPVTLVPAGGTVPVTDIFVRFKPTDVQAYNGNITHTSSGATTKNLALTGNGVNLPPSLTTPSSSGYTINSANAGATISSIGCSAVSQRGVFYSTTNGFQYHTGTKVSESGTFGTGAFTVGLTGLNASTTYYFIAYAINSSDTSFTSQSSFTTIKPEPSEFPSGFSAISRSSEQIDVSWTDAGGVVVPTGYLIKCSNSDSFSQPVDGTDPTEDTDFSDGYGQVKVLHGTGGTYSFTGLSASTTYYFHIWPYCNSGSAIDFKTVSEPSANATTQTTSAGTLASWVLTSNALPSDVNENVTAGNFTGGSGIGTITYGSSGAYANSWTTSSSPDANDYYQITLAPNSGYTITITAVNFSERRSSTGITKYQVRYSKNSDFSSPVTLATVDVPDNESIRTGNITGLNILVNSGETIYFRWYGYAAEAGTGTWRIQASTLNITGTVSLPVPTITVVPSSLSGFTYVVGNGPSNEQSFTISGGNLSNNITITPPAHYQISIQTGGSFSPTNPITLVQSGGTVVNTTIYVRLQAGLSTGNYNSEDITASSAGASNQTVTCNGSVTNPTPDISTSVSSLSGFSCVSGNASSSQSYTVSADYLTNDVTVTAPADFEVSTDNITFNTSVVLARNGGDILGEPKTIYVRIKSTATAGSKNGNITHASTGATTRNVSVSGNVYKPEPANQPTNLQAAVASSTQINLTWTDAVAGSQAPDYYLILANTTGTFSDPVDGTEPSTDTNMGDGSGTFKVAHGTQALSVTGLSANTQYYFKMWPYTNSGSNINFKTDGTIQTATATTSVTEPSCASDLIISEYYEGASNDKYLEIYNNTGSSVNLAGYKISIYANGSSTPSDIALSGTIANKSVFIIANSSANSTILAAANATSTSITFNGNDAVALRTTANTLVDVIGQIGYDPGTEWGSGLTSTADNTLVRKPEVTSGDNIGSDAFNPSVQWIGYANTTSYMGSHTMNCSVKPEPANQPTNLQAAVASSTQINLTWTDAVAGSQAPDYYLILANTTGTFSNPVDGTEPQTDTNMGDGSGTFKVAHGTQSLSVTGLSASTQYYFKMWPYTNNGNYIDFKTDGTIQTASATTSSSGGACATDLIISEYYEGASNDKYLEIYNNTGNSVNLAGYKISIYANGSSTPSDIALSGTIANKSVFIIANSSANSTILAAANATSTGITFNGNDAVALRTTANTLVDVIGQIGYDPGTEWGSGLTSTADNTLVRKPEVTSGDNNGSDAFNPSIQWIGYANTTSYMGSHTMSCGYTAPSITAHPQNVTKCAGENTSFTATSSGTVTARQWLVNKGDNIWMEITDNAIYSGATTATLTLTGVTTSMNNYQYCLKLNNQACIVYSNAARLTVNPRPAEPLIIETSNQCGKTVLTRGIPTDGSVWYWQGTTANGTQTIKNAVTDTVLQGNDGTYYLRAYYSSTGCWSETSASQLVTVNIKPVVSVDNAIPGCGEGSIRVNSDQNTQQTFELLDQNGDPLSPEKIWSGVASSKTFDGVVTGNYKAKVTLENGCVSELPASAVALANNSLVPEPSISDAYRCGSGTITITASATSGNQMQFYEHVTNIPGVDTLPTFTDNSEPFQYTTSNLTNPATTRVWARMYNTVTGCKSNWVSAMASTTGERGLWTGSGANSYWSNTDNWSDCTVPLIADDVIIPTNRTVVINSDVVCRNISVDGGATITVESGRNLTVTGNIVFSPNAQVNINGNLVLSGSSQQSISADTITAANLTIANSNSINCNTDLVVTGTLTLNAGILYLNNNTLTIGTSSSSRGNITGTFGSSCYIAAYKTGTSEAGKVKRFVAGGGISFLFPVGDNDEYSPFSISFTSGTFGSNASIEVFVADEKHPNMVANEPTWYITRYWKYEPEGISGAVYNLDITYMDADVYTGGELLNYVKQHIYPIKYSPTGWIASRCESDPTYHFSAQFGQGQGSNNGGTNTLSWTGVTSFSEVTGGGGSGGPLPVKLLCFNAKRMSDNVLLNWSTATEDNNHYFSLMRSTDAANYQLLAIIAGKGNSVVQTHYSFIDAEPPDGIIYYKLCQTDYDGNSQCPGLTVVKTSQLDGLPAYFIVNEDNMVKLATSAVFQGNYLIDILDPTGKRLCSQSYQCTDEKSLPVNCSLLKGNLYCIRMIHNSEVTVMKFIY